MNSPPLISGFAVLFGLVATGCAVHPTPVAPPPSATAGLHLPNGCDQDLSGSYALADDATYRYLALEDGGVLTLTASLASSDGGLPKAVLTFRRSDQGFSGESVGQVILPKSGEECEAHFPAEVRGCADGGLLIASPDSTPLGEGCQTPPSPHPSPWVEHRLIRLPQAGSTAAK